MSRTFDFIKNKMPDVEVELITDEKYPALVITPANIDYSGKSWIFDIRATFGKNSNVVGLKMFTAESVYIPSGDENSFAEKRALDMLKIIAAKKKYCRVEIFNIHKPSN